MAESCLAAIDFPEPGQPRTRTRLICGLAVSAAVGADAVRPSMSLPDVAYANAAQDAPPWRCAQAQGGAEG